ncbi:hypothetical protein Tco_0072019 [Tanacetum coccineum]
MEILLEPTSNKLMVEHAEFDESDTHVLERFNTLAENPVKEILLKLNLPDHRILKDEGEEKIDDDWYLLLDDLDFGDILEIERVEISPFECKMGKNGRNKRKQLEKYQMIYSDIGPSLSTEKPLTQEEAAREALAIDIFRRFAILEEERPEEEAIIKVKREALIEKEDPRACVIPIRLEAKINLNALADNGFDINVMPYRVYKELGREELKNVNRGIKMLNHLKAEPMGLLKDVLCQRIFVHLWEHSEHNRKDHIYLDRICHQTFRAAKTSLNTEESDSDDEENYGIQRNKFGVPVYGPKPVKYLNCHDLLDRSIALQETMGTYDDEAGSSRSKRSQKYETVEEAMLPRVHHPFLLWEGYWNVLNQLAYGEAIDEMLTIKLCVADDELRTKKIIKFRLCGRAFSWTLLEFAKRLALYHSQEIKEEGFDVYFQGGLRSDEHFNAREYWLSISREENLSLLRSHASTIRKPVLRVLHKMITYGLCQRTTGWMKRKGAGSQKDSMICCGQFITKIAKRKNLLTEEVLNSLSALIYCRDLDTTTLRELIDYKGRLNPEVPEPGVLRVAIPRPPRASMQDLYERMGSMEIR